MSFTTRTEATRDDWQTPLALVSALGTFDLDPCANCDAPMRLATRGFTLADDGLSQEWAGRVWLNPPYGAVARVWIARLAQHGNGIALIPPRLGAKWFHEAVLGTFDGILFHKGRIAFLDPCTGLPVKGNNTDSIFVAYGATNVAALETSGLPGKMWKARFIATLLMEESRERNRPKDSPQTEEIALFDINFLRKKAGY